MRVESTYSNPLWWVQFHLQGGFRRQVATAAVYLGLAGIGSVVTFRIDSRLNPAQVATGWLLVLSLIQIGVLILVGSSGIRRAIQREFATGMIESHRLSPISGSAAAVGYLIGPVIQTLVLFGCGLVAGTAFCVAGGFDWQAWWVAMGLLLWLAVMLWSLVSVLALSTSGSVNVLMIGSLLLVATGQFLLGVVPGVGYLVGLTYWDLSPQGLRVWLSPEDGYVLLLQAAFSGLFLVGAARKFRRSDVRAFPPDLGLALVFVVVLTGGLGLLCHDQWQSLWTRNLIGVSGVRPVVQLLGSLLSAALFGLMPVAAAAGAAADRRAADSHPNRAGRVVATSLASTALIVGGYWYLVSGWFRLPEHVDGVTWLWTAVLIGIGLLAAGPHLWLWYRTRDQVLWPALFYLFVFWVFTPVADAIRASVYETVGAPSLTWISGLSPAGGLLLIWEGSAAPLTPGLTIQVLLGLMWWGLVWQVSRRERRSSAESP